MLTRVNPSAANCPTRRWARGALHVLVDLLVVVVLLIVAGRLAALVVPVPEGTFTGEAAKAVDRSMNRACWVSWLIYAGLCVLVFHLVPLAWRRWRAAREMRPRAG